MLPPYFYDIRSVCLFLPFVQFVRFRKKIIFLNFVTGLR